MVNWMFGIEVVKEIIQFLWPTEVSVTEPSRRLVGNPPECQFFKALHDESGSHR
jgi:hypothetical protein